MSPHIQPPRPKSLQYHRRLTIQARLTLSFAGLVIGCGAVLITLVYLYMRYVPTYQFQPAQPIGSGIPADETGLPSMPALNITAIITAEDVLNNLLIASAIALVVMAVLGGTLGRVLAGRIIKPLGLINAAAERASAGALDHRVAIGGPKDEIRQLSDTFDRMLDSLERSFSAHRRFAANASHELRTPLATTKTMIDVVLADPDANASDLRALAERIREVNRSNIETVDALLDLAGTDQASLARERIDVVAIAHAVADPRADDALRARVQLKVIADSHAFIIGHAVLVQRAIDNLLRNAIQYNHPNGDVVVRVVVNDSGARVTVTNTGPPVAPETMESLVEPFVRGAGRVRTTNSGHGLGLALVAAVAQAHRGSLNLEANRNGGLTVNLDLPHVDTGAFEVPVGPKPHA